MFPGYAIIALLCLELASPALTLLCPSSAKEAFVRTEGKYYSGGSGTKHTVTSKEECVSTCRLDPSCTSANYFPDANECEVMTTTIGKGVELQERSGAEFYQKICVDALGACLTSFNRLPQTQFIGWAREVIRGTTLQACLGKCLNTKESTAGYRCMSIMYYYRDSECVLNAESIEHYPQLAKRADTSRGDVDYFTNNCLGEWGPWSEWTECQDNGRQTRSRACTPFGACSGEATEERECARRQPPPPPPPPPARPCCQMQRPCCMYNSGSPSGNVFVPLNPSH